MAPPAKRVKRESEDGVTPAKKVARKSPARKTPEKAKQQVSQDVNDEQQSVRGLKIVVTGVTEAMGRDTFEHKLQDAGAQLTSAVSGVTNILIYGPKLEDGRDHTEGTKYRKACELISTGKSKAALRIMSESEFYEAFPDLSPHPISSTFGGADQAESAVLQPKGKAAAHFLWSEKWRPASTDDFVCNREAYLDLKLWLLNWDASKAEQKVALLCGPPGVGKTSAALAVSGETGFQLLEFNASDTRSQKALKGLAPVISGGTTLSKGNLYDKLLILMDEADGLSSGDRGGAQELNRLIKTTRVPIVCTCNDRQHPKVRTLAKSCRTISFAKPDRSSAVRRALQIAQAEGFTTTASFVTALFDASNGDMRQLLNSLQLSLMGTPVHSPGTLRNLIVKDIEAGDDPFASTRRLFASNEASFDDRLSVFFSDYDLVPLIVQENYLRLLAKRPADLKTLMTVADSISYSDVLSSKIRGQGHWDLLPAMGYFSTVFPTQRVTGGLFRVEFPRTLGRISSTNKHKRQYAELGVATGHAGKRLIIDGYYDLLGDEAVAPLLKESQPIPDRIAKFFEFLAEYGLTKELIVENLMDTRNSKSVKPYDKVETKTKTALTRVTNAEQKPGEFTQRKMKGATGTAKAKASPRRGAKKSAMVKAEGRRTGLAGGSPPSKETSETLESEHEEEDIDAVKEAEEEEAKMGGIF